MLDPKAGYGAGSCGPPPRELTPRQGPPETLNQKPPRAVARRLVAFARPARQRGGSRLPRLEGVPDAARGAPVQGPKTAPKQKQNHNPRRSQAPVHWPGPQAPLRFTSAGCPEHAAAFFPFPHVQLVPSPGQTAQPWRHSYLPWRGNKPPCSHHGPGPKVQSAGTARAGRHCATRRQVISQPSDRRTADTRPACIVLHKMQLPIPSASFRLLGRRSPCRHARRPGTTDPPVLASATRSHAWRPGRRHLSAAPNGVRPKVPGRDRAQTTER